MPMIKQSRERSKPGNLSSAQKTIAQVKRRHELQLMNIEGVEGVGIGEKQGRPVIKVYVSGAKKTLQKKIPKVLESYPVVIEVTGEFRALDKLR